MRLGTRKLSISALAVLVGSLALLLSACGGTTTGGKGSPVSDDKQIFSPLIAGENSGDFDTMDPALIQFGDDYNIAQLIFPPLITTDDKLVPIPWAATKLPDVSADGLTYTFHLQSGMKWSDGTVIDANTYAYSINRSIDKCTASGVWSYLAQIKGAEAFHKIPCPAGAASQPDSVNLTSGPNPSVVVSDAQTLKITLGAPAAYFLASFTYPTSWAQPKQLITQYKDKWLDHLADGAGFGGNLFKLTKWDHAGHFSLTRNDSYWGQKAKLKEIDWTQYKDGTTQWNDFKSGKGDEGTPTAADIANAKTLPGYQEIPELTVRYLQPNWKLAPFDDVRVRNAFDLAFDRTILCNQVLNGTCLPTHNIIINGLPGFNANLKDPAGRTGATALTADLADAQKAAAAYRDEKCAGSDYSKCTPITLTIASGSAAETTRSQFWQTAWQTAFPGWKITVQAVPRSDEISKAATYQLVTEGWGADYADPQDFTSLLLHTGADYNYGSASVKDADDLMDKADVNTDSASRLKQYQDAEQLLTTNTAWISWGQAKGIVVIKPTIANYHYTSSLTVALPTWQASQVVQG